MSRIPEATIQEIRHRADIVALVSRYVELKQAGRNWKGLCPFHNEKTPSFNVNPDRDMFHCFGCQEGGDVIGFLMKHEGLSFPEATRTLAGELGIEVPEERGAGDAGLTTRIFEANQLAQDLYREALRAPEGKIARDYLIARGFDGASADEFGIGFAPARWDAVAERLAKARIKGDVGEQAGLLAPRKSGKGFYDRLRGPAEEMQVLATAYSQKDKGGTGRHEPMIMTINYGKGRVFHTPMGHADYSQECVGFIAAFTRGAEWAATGKVTLPLPKDFPSADKVSQRKFD